MEVASDFGLTASVAKTKLMVSGREVTAEDKAPFAAGDEQVESVNEFSPLGSVISSSGRVHPDTVWPARPNSPPVEERSRV